LLVGVVGLGCLPSKPAATPSVSVKDTEQDAEISKVKSSITTLDEGKASKSSVNDLSDRVSKLSQGASPDLSGYYKKAEVDAAIVTAVNNAIANLKNEKPWATSSSSSTPSQTGSVIFSTLPASIPQILSDSSASAQSSYYTMKITNNSSQWQYVKPIINLNLASSYSSTVINEIRIVMSSGSCNLVGTADKDFIGKSNSIAYDGDNSIFSVSPPVNTSATSMVVMPIGGCNDTGEFRVGAGQTIDVLIQITSFGTVDTRIWNISNSISTRSL